MAVTGVAWPAKECRAAARLPSAAAAVSTAVMQPVAAASTTALPPSALLLPPSSAPPPTRQATRDSPAFSPVRQAALAGAPVALGAPGALPSAASSQPCTQPLPSAQASRLGAAASPLPCQHSPVTGPEKPPQPSSRERRLLALLPLPPPPPASGEGAGGASLPGPPRRALTSPRLTSHTTTLPEAVPRATRLPLPLLGHQLGALL